MIKKKINISIISHNQANMIEDLLHDLEKFDFYNEILITINCKENIKELKKFHTLPLTFIINNKTHTINIPMINGNTFNLYAGKIMIFF